MATKTPDLVKTSSPSTTKGSSAKSDGLFKKILAVQQQVNSVPKRGYNSFHKYNYATEADILTVKETLNENRLIVLPTTLHEETGFKPDGKSWASVTLLFRVIDADSGESIESQFTGYAEDNNDKAIYKATTGANKYFYLKFFGIATEDDPERDEVAPPVRGGMRATAQPAKSSGKEKEPATPPPPPSPQKTQALINANKILTLQKQYDLSNEEVLLHGEIESIRELAEAGNADLLAQAYAKLATHIQLDKAI